MTVCKYTFSYAHIITIIKVINFVLIISFEMDKLNRMYVRFLLKHRKYIIYYKKRIQNQNIRNVNLTCSDLAVMLEKF